MKKNATIKKIVLFCVVAAVLVFAVGSIIGSGKPIFTQEESIEDWAAQFEDATAPEGCVLYRKGYGIGAKGMSSSGKAYYGYYWIIKNINSKQDDFPEYYFRKTGAKEITTQDLSAFDEDGNAVLSILPIDTIYEIDGLDEALKGLTEKDLQENDYYILYIVKYGS